MDIYATERLGSKCEQCSKNMEIASNTGCGFEPGITYAKKGPALSVIKNESCLKQMKNNMIKSNQVKNCPVFLQHMSFICSVISAIYARCFYASSVTHAPVSSPLDVKSVILRLLLVLIFVSTVVSAEPELLQRQFSSSVYAAHGESGVIESADSADHGSLYRARAADTCHVQCKTSKKRQFCASDGKTYASKCEIRKVNKCENKDIKFVNKGPCKASGSNREKSSRRNNRDPAENCLEELRKIEREFENSDAVHRPSCRDDGSYMPVQCLAGFCWCVRSDGSNVPGTSVKGRIPDCSKGKGESNMKKRGAVSSQKCMKMDRNRFNINLVRTFIEDFARTMNQSIQGQGEHDNQAIIEWKFKELDKNQDGVLDGREMKTLNRLVRNAIRPKKCAKRFPKYCDDDKNGEVSEEEWSSCLDNPSNPSLLQPDSPPRNHGGEGDGGGDSGQITGSPQRDIGGNRNSKTDSTPDENSSEFLGSQPTTSTDCFEDRRQAEENDRNTPNGQIFVPECVTGGLYRKEQCHKFTGYCWCVDEKTGAPIPGYTTLNETPDCSTAKPQRVMKGCVNPQRTLFLTKVLDTLSNEMVSFSEENPTNSMISMDPDLSLEERAVRWKFAVLDTNSNDELTRKETKDVKRMLTRTISGHPTLRKCARNFLRFCDENNDTKVSTTEWVACLKLIESPSDGSPRESRQGANPLEKYLRGFK